MSLWCDPVRARSYDYSVWLSTVFHDTCVMLHFSLHEIMRKNSIRLQVGVVGENSFGQKFNWILSHTQMCWAIFPFHTVIIKETTNKLSNRDSPEPTISWSNERRFKMNTNIHRNQITHKARQTRMSLFASKLASMTQILMCRVSVINCAKSVGYTKSITQILKHNEYPLYVFDSPNGLVSVW